MKIYIMKANDESLIINEGFELATRFRKNKETGEKTYFPVGTYDASKSRFQYFFLNKSLHEKIENEHLERIDYVVFKPHNNIPNLQIAFPNHKDTSAMLVFDGYYKSQVSFIQTSTEIKEAECPYNGKPSLHFKENNNHYICTYCRKPGFIVQDEEEAEKALIEYGIDPNINPKTLLGKFIHSEKGTVHIFDNDSGVETFNFLDTFAIKIENGSTVRMLLTKSKNGIDKQFYIEFTHVMNEPPKIEVKLLDVKAYNQEQYQKQVGAARNYEDNLKSDTNINGSLVYRFPDKFDNDSVSEGPLSALLNIKDQFEDETEITEEVTIETRQEPIKQEAETTVEVNETIVIEEHNESHNNE